MSKTTSVLPENVIPLTLYNNHRFINVYFANDNFYILRKDGTYCVRPWHYNKRNRQYGILIRNDKNIPCMINKNVCYNNQFIV